MGERIIGRAVLGAERPGSSLTTESIRTIAGSSPPVKHVVADRDLAVRQMSADSFVKTFVMPADQDQMVRAANSDDISWVKVSPCGVRRTTKVWAHPPGKVPRPRQRPVRAARASRLRRRTAYRRPYDACPDRTGGNRGDGSPPAPSAAPAPGCSGERAGEHLGKRVRMSIRILVPQQTSPGDPGRI